MEPTLYNGQEILINRFVYKMTKPQKDDVIVFLPGGNQNAHYYIKREGYTRGKSTDYRWYLSMWTESRRRMRPMIRWKMRESQRMKLY